MDNQPNAEAWRATLTNIPFSTPVGNSCPVRKLPFDLLSYLFGFVPDSFFKEIADEVYLGQKADYRIHRSVTSPWIYICRVCRDWHDVAMSTPSLWRVIIIPSKSRSPFDRIARQLELSKDVPIDVQIRMTESYGYPTAFVPKLCTLLLTQFHRWRSFDVRVVTAKQINEVLDTITSTSLPIAPKFTSVRLALRAEYHIPWQSLLPIPSERFMLFGSSAPRLETISLNGVDVDWNQSWVSSASNLTSLEIRVRREEDHLSWVQFATILRGAPRLEVLIYASGRRGADRVDPNPESTSGDYNMSPIMLLELKKLQVLLSAVIMVQLLKRCHIPSLEELTITPVFTNGQQEHELEALVAQLVAPVAITGTYSEAGRPPAQERSHSLLAGVRYFCMQQANYHDFHFPVGCIDTLYANLYRLTSLVLDRDDTPAFTDLLFTPTGQPQDARLPTLESLTIQRYLGYWDIRDICALAWHRKEIGFPLRELVLTSVGARLPDEWLLWCRENLETFRLGHSD